MAEVRMPKMGDGMEEGTINSWLKQEGDQVTSGEAIAEVETDKANVEIPAYESGVLTKIITQVGQTVPVGEVIAHIGAVGASVGNGAHAPANSATEAHPAGNGAAHNAPTAGEEGQTPPVSSAPAANAPQPPSINAGTQASGNGEATDAHTELSASPGEMERVKASPLARRMAREMGLDLARVRGTGPGGRIVERDVTAHQGQTPLPAFAPPAVQAAPAVAPAPTVSPAPVAAPRPNAPAPTLATQDIKPSKMREAIARRTALSKQTLPHFYVTMLIEMDRALGLLKELNADATEGKVTVNDVVVKACAVALARVPEVNASWTSEGVIRRYAEAHIGVAVGIDEGLIIPVVRDCQSKTLRQISVEAKALIGKARAGQLKPEEYSGGTFSVSNLGMMGVDEFIAIINPPEAAILAIGGVTRDPVVLPGSDEIVIRSRMKVSLSADHRLLDGVIAARFLQEVKKALEAPFGLLS